jgi:hypothetical protein
MKRNLNARSLVLLIGVGTIATLSLPSPTIAATPPDPVGCPDGWVPRPPELNPALGDCIPDTISPDNGGGLQVGQLPNLKIKAFTFAGPKVATVQVINQGSARSKANKLVIALRKIDGNVVNRQLEVKVPSIPPNSAAVISINASGILPSATELKDTRFKLTIDPMNVVQESNEADNTAWHNQ